MSTHHIVLKLSFFNFYVSSTVGKLPKSIVQVFLNYYCALSTQNSGTYQALNNVKLH